MTEKYGWCRNVTDTVVLTPSYREYCIFHLPAENYAEEASESFNALVFNRINRAKERNETCDLSGTIFKGDISFKDYDVSNPLPEIDFSKTAFYGETDFSRVKFNGNTNFKESTFLKNVKFSAASFTGNVDFSESTFNEEADFGGTFFYGKVGFHKVLFNKFLLFLNYPQRSVSFTLATFKEGAIFYGQNFKEISDFASLIIKEKIVFQYVDLSYVNIFNVDFLKIDFLNCKWKRRKGRNILYSEYQVLKDFKYGYIGIFLDELRNYKKVNKTIISTIKKVNKNYKSIQGRINNVQSLYRMLKRKYKDENNEVEVSNWHYGEKEMFRKISFWRRHLLSISTLYWLSSGYGERPLRAGGMLILLIAGFALLLNYYGIEINNTLNNDYSMIQHSSFHNIRRFGLLVHTTFQHILFIKNPDYVPFSYHGKFFTALFTKLLIPLQTAIFALAVRNKFRR
jgi:uncharacterized protein YjbI with pentapeptide repeats